MPTSSIEKPGESLGSAWGVVSGSHSACDFWADQYCISQTPIAGHLDLWNRAIHRAACCLVVGGVANLPVDPFQFIGPVEPSTRPIVTAQGTNWVRPCDQGKQVHEHRKYLEGLVATGAISPQMERRAWEIWGNLWTKYPDLTVPDAGPGPDGEVQYTWSRRDHYLALDIIPDQPSEFFYRNRQTGTMWECESSETVLVVSDELATYLKLFLIGKTA